MDVPALEVEYEKFLDNVEEEAADPEWEIENHPSNEILDRYSPEFGAWVIWLQDKLNLKRVGYPFEKDDLTLLEWKCLDILENHYQRQGQSEN